ncbi:MAG: hypothetical protein K6E13_00995 [Lachnospiraceae bacterium]|nr:hypothetical protein [Lachnospiraceae bacterium]
MKNFIKKFAVLAMAAAITLTAAPINALAAVSAPSSVTLYAGSTDGSSTRTTYISISGLKKSSTIKSVKSSKKSVAAYYSKSLSSYITEYASSSSSGYKSYSGDIEVLCKKAGSATISYKIDNKTYKTKVNVKKYTNPVKSLKINGKDVASKFKKSSYVSAKKPSKTIKNFKVSATAASGWKITSISCSESAESDSTNGSLSNYNKGLKSRTLIIDRVKKGSSCYINVYCVNTKTNGTLNISYSMYK